jgi:hypothetical protein
MAQNFKFNLDDNIAHVVFERVNGKNLIKTEKNWQGVFDYYVSIYSPGGLHYKNLKSFKSSKDVFYAKNDLKTRLKSIVKILNKIVYDIIENGEQRSTHGDYMSGADGKDMLVDIEDNHSLYYQRVKRRIGNEREFVKAELIDIVTTVISTVKEKDLQDMLVYLTDIFLKEPDKIFSILEEIVKINIEYLYIGKLYPPYDKDINIVLKYVKGYWSSSSVTNIEVKQVKTKMKQYVTKAVKSSNKKYHASVANAAIVYIFLLSILDI